MQQQEGTLLQPLPTDRLDVALTNLFTHCAGLEPGRRVLIVGERRRTGFYDDLIAPTVARMAADRGYKVNLLNRSFCEDVVEMDPGLAHQMAAADCTMFFARLGDQMRFRNMPSGARNIVCYTLDHSALISGFGTAHHQAFVQLKQAIDQMVGAAQQIRVTCPRGTDFAGPGLDASADARIDVGITRFPMSVFAPVSARQYSGRAVLAGFLLGTGSRYYQPYGRALQRPVAAHFAKGRLIGFTGLSADVALANAHYDTVAERFGLDRNAVHSWHAGIHPGCAYADPVERDFLRWGGGAFGNPRLLHFHTCGSAAPGEISWNILDPTIRIDGVAVWENGRLMPGRVPGGADILARYSCAAALFANPARAVGIADDLPGLAQG